LIFWFFCIKAKEREPSRQKNESLQGKRTRAFKAKEQKPFKAKEQKPPGHKNRSFHHLTILLINKAYLSALAVAVLA